MRTILIALIITTSLVSCAKESEYQNVSNENLRLKTQIENLMSQRDSISRENQQLKNQQYNELSKKLDKAVVYRTVEEAIKLVDDYYKFYNKNFAYRNVDVRQVDGNHFKISVEECINKDSFVENDFYWNAKVYNLQVDNDGKYKMIESAY